MRRTGVSALFNTPPHKFRLVGLTAMVVLADEGLTVVAPAAMDAELKCRFVS